VHPHRGVGLQASDRLPGALNDDVFVRAVGSKVDPERPRPGVDRLNLPTAVVPAMGDERAVAQVPEVREDTGRPLIGSLAHPLGSQFVQKLGRDEVRVLRNRLTGEVRSVEGPDFKSLDPAGPELVCRISIRGRRVKDQEKPTVGRREQGCDTTTDSLGDGGCLISHDELVGCVVALETLLFVGSLPHDEVCGAILQAKVTGEKAADAYAKALLHLGYHLPDLTPEVVLQVLELGRSGHYLGTAAGAVAEDAWRTWRERHVEGHG